MGSPRLFGIPRQVQRASPSTRAIALVAVVLLSACGSAATPAPSSPPMPSPAEAAGLDCAGQVVSGDIDRFAGTQTDPIAALQDEFEGLLTTDGVALGSYEGRPAVVVTRDQRVVFIGSYGQDGRIYQYTGCVEAGIKPSGT
jgi:hypothetical protein